MAWLPAVLVGTVTAVGGGAVRDLLLTRIPAVLGGNGLYATVAVVVSGLYIVCAHFRIPALGIVGGVLGAVLLRLVANRRGWSLPGGLPLEPSRALARMRRRSKGGRPSDPPEEFPHDRRD